jgi:hypothetical protein
MKFWRSNPLSRAHWLIPMLLIFAFTSPLATTLPFSPVLDCCELQNANITAFFPFATPVNAT